jgi:hypothetical protein
MNYDVMIPIKIFFFTVGAAYLLVYFVFLLNYIRHHLYDIGSIIIAVIHILIMVGGLLLTGFATKFL